MRAIRIVIMAIVVVIALICAIGIPVSTNKVALPLSGDVKNYSDLIDEYAHRYDIPEYKPLIKAVMMQESRGKGTDPMQASEGNYNKKYSKKPGSIDDPEYSIDCGVHQLADDIEMAGCKGPDDMEGIMLAIQGYNFGDGYIIWALNNYGEYTEENAVEFSDMMEKKLGTNGYGDKRYVKHVMRYYSY